MKQPTLRKRVRATTLRFETAFCWEYKSLNPSRECVIKGSQVIQTAFTCFNTFRGAPKMTTGRLPHKQCPAAWVNKTRGAGNCGRAFFQQKPAR
jgi:hypothetical protein